ncbi:MAG: hypothetical protein LBM70_08305 [Victivallales bacterium]|jgi:tRNA 2-thiocytidine biosynthesis protein TtcA|nr:hypothetical protein [Victivallales bacterium]
MTDDPAKTPAFRELCKLSAIAVTRYAMIAEGDRILVGLSGGKDSFMLLHALHALKRKAPINFELIAATFDPGFPEFNIDVIQEYCRVNHWEHRTLKLDIGAILEEKKYTSTPCVLCSRLRRGKLYGLAEQEKCQKLALGQHFDDIAASFLMSLCRGQGLSTMAPNVATKAKEKIRVIRPFALAPESLIIRCRDEWKLPHAGKCRYEEQLADGDRAYFRGIVDQLAERIPNLRGQMLRSLSNIQSEYLLDPAYLKLEDSPGSLNGKQYADKQ